MYFNCLLDIIGEDIQINRFSLLLSSTVAFVLKSCVSVVKWTLFIKKM